MPEHAELFGRAALVAREGHRWEMVSSLLDEEREKLVYERDHKWHGSKMLWYSVGLCAMGAATQGWDQTGSNGANLSFPQEFNINPAPVINGVPNPNAAYNQWIVGLINSIIYLTAGLM